MFTYLTLEAMADFCYTIVNARRANKASLPLQYCVLPQKTEPGELPMNKKKFTIADKADILHQASLLYMAGNVPIDYGTGDTYTSVEVHMLKYIIENPGKTVTDLSRDWDRTKAAISLMMKKIEDKGLVTRKEAPDSKKKQLYYATELGKKLNETHKKYDTKVFGKTLSYMKENCTDEEIELCFNVLREFIKARRRKHYSPES